MKRYAHGLDVLGAADTSHLWWENVAIVVGALASVATLIEVTWRFGGRR